MNESQALEEIRSALERFGADETSIPELLDEAIYNELVKQWGELKGPPKVVDVAEAVGVDSTGTAPRSLRRLEAAGRVRKLARGVWLPV